MTTTTTTTTTTDCTSACLFRCSKAGRPNVCMRACSTCCYRCNCVPPGTSGNHLVCGACYAQTTHNGRTKCPWSWYISIHPSILPSFLLSNLFYLSTHVFCINFIGSFHHTQLSLSPCLYEVTQWFYNWLSPARPPGRPPLYHYHHQLGCFIILYLVFLVSIALFEQVLRKIMMSVAFKWGDGFEQKQITNPDATMQH